MDGAWADLQAALAEFGRRRCVDGGVEVRSPGPIVVVIGVPQERVALLLAINRVAPGRGFVVWDPADLQIGPAGAELLGGVTADEDGRCRRIRLDRPARVTYLINLFTAASVSVYDAPLDREVAAFAAIEAAARCPTSGGPRLEALVNDKVWTRILAASRGVRVPRCVAWTTDPGRYAGLPDVPEVRVRALGPDADVRASIEALGCARFVIKPSGPHWLGGRLVHLGDTDHLDEAEAHFARVIAALNHGDAVLIEERVGGAIVPPYGVRVRVYAARRPRGAAETVGLYGNVGVADGVVSGDHSSTFAWETLAPTLGLDAAAESALTVALHRAGREILDAIAAVEDRGPDPFARTDLIGLDVLLHPEGGGWVPVVIEVNDHDCTSVIQAWTAQHPPLRSDSLDLWVDRMLARSWELLLNGRTVLVIGGGGLSKRRTFEVAQRLGVRIVLVESDPGHPAIPLCDRWLNLDIEDHTRDDAHADAIVAAVAAAGLTVDGALTFWEDDAPLAARVCARLGLAGHPVDAADRAKSKFLTHQALCRPSELYHQPPGWHLGIGSWALRDEADLDAIPADAYPLFTKYDAGSAAFGVDRVDDAATLRDRFRAWRDGIDRADIAGVGLGFAHRFLAQSAVAGSEHDVDLVLQGGRLVAAFVTDNAPIGGTHAGERAAALPSVRAEALQRLMVEGAARACRLVGLTDGPVNVELMLTPRGVKILEINGRTGGFYIPQWVDDAFGVDLVTCAFTVACGIETFVRSDIRPRHQRLSFQCYPDEHADKLGFDVLDRLCEDPHTDAVRFEAAIHRGARYPEPYAAIGVEGSDLATAVARMTTLLDACGVDDPELNWLRELRADRG